jgi:hypothetical protein
MPGKELTPYIREINELADNAFDQMYQQSEALVIDSDEKQDQANEMIAQAKKLSGKIENRRKEIYDEFYPPAERKKMKEINDRAKLYKDRLATLVKGLEQKFVAYMYERRLAHAKAEAERLEREKKEREEHEKKMAFVPPEAQVPAPPAKKPAPNKLLATRTTQTGSSYTKKEKYFVISEFANVPDDYKVLDEVKVRKAMHKGIEIPGIEYRERDRVATRLK